MKNYLIKLFPVSAFFFGSEKTFDHGGTINYFAKSNAFPQQTSLLGMLRKEVLIQMGLYKESAEYSANEMEKIKELIGESFSLSGNNDFGCIKKISPSFLFINDKAFIQAPFDNLFKFKKKPGRSYLTKENSFIPVMKNIQTEKYYKSKDNANVFSDFLGADSELIQFDNIFSVFVKSGNCKDRSEKDEDKYFKQLSYGFKDKKTSFAFFAEVDVKLNNSIINLGGDNSVFYMKTEEINDDRSFLDLFKTINKDENKVVLLSDCLVENSIFDSCDFSITDTMDFRTVRMKFGRFLNRNKKYSFLKRGSVFYSKTAGKVRESLYDPTLRQVGYNIFI